MMTAPQFMNGVNFFETTLVENLTSNITQDSGKMILIPPADLARIPTFPFILVIGETGNEEVVQCTGYQNGVTGSRLVLNRSAYGEPTQGYLSGTRVICAPSFEYFLELQDFATNLMKEYKGLFGMVMLNTIPTGSTEIPEDVVIAFETEDPGSMDIDSSFGTVNHPTSLFKVRVGKGKGVCNQKPVSCHTYTDVDLTEITMGIPFGDHKKILIYVDEYSEIKAAQSESGTNPSIPSIPLADNGLELSTFMINGFGVTGTITDRRIFI